MAHQVACHYPIVDIRKGGPGEGSVATVAGPSLPAAPTTSGHAFQHKKCIGRDSWPAMPARAFAHLPLDAAGFQRTAALLGALLEDLVNTVLSRCRLRLVEGSTEVLDPAPDYLCRVNCETRSGSVLVAGAASCRELRSSTVALSVRGTALSLLPCLAFPDLSTLPLRKEIGPARRRKCLAANAVSEDAQ